MNIRFICNFFWLAGCKRKGFFTVIFALIVLLVLSISLFGLDEDKLKKLALTDIIAEVRQAAARAIALNIEQSHPSVSSLEQLVIEHPLPQVRQLLVPVLARRYEAVEDLHSFSQLEEKFTRIEELSQHANPNVRKAAEKALSVYYVLFHLKGVEGYSVEELEQLIRNTSAEDPRARAASEALVSIYPNVKTTPELKELITISTNSLIKEAGVGALGLRYAGPLTPYPTLSELQRMVLSEKVPRGVRQAASRALGELAGERMTVSELIEITREHENELLRVGMGTALSEALIRSDRSLNDLLKMAVAATIYRPYAYRQALVKALAHRFAFSRDQ